MTDGGSDGPGGHNDGDIEDDSHERTSDFQEPLHVYDLPQIYQKPSAASLLHVLDLLSVDISTFSSAVDESSRNETVLSTGVPRYLTDIISSPLAWIEDYVVREQIWETASTRLSERSGRSAMSSITREFRINEKLDITLHEPGLTEDNLGLKTWTSSVLLAKRLSSLHPQMAPTCNQVLELGAGTGLVGIAAACLWKVNVVLTDLPEIVPNLEQNLKLNAESIQKHQGNVQARPLDWADLSCSPRTEADRFSVILAADPIYSSEHPKLLVDTVSRWLQPFPQARFILELPLRHGYAKERSELRRLLETTPLEVVEEGTEIGYDDWRDNQGNLTEVECWWSVWKPLFENPSDQ